MITSHQTFRLSLMMFLQFFTWGAWYVTVGNYMTHLGMNSVTHWAYTVSPIAGILAPFFLGLVADRYFAAEKVLGVLHLIGGLTLIAAPHFSGSAFHFLSLLFLHMLCYMPTLGLSNSIALQNIQDQEKQFPLIRVFGTIGWIVAGIFVSAVLHADESPLPLYTGGAAAVLLGLYSFTLPHTPPKMQNTAVTAREILGLDALAKLKGKAFWVFLASSFLISIPLAAYYNFAPIFVNSSGIKDPAFKMSFGQMSEVAFMLAMPFFFRRLGVKMMLLVGMGAWVLRYFLFSLGAVDGISWMILLGVALHGICYDFFFVTGQIYVDGKSTPEIRSQAQGFLVFATYGAGMLIGAQISGWVYNGYLAGSAALGADQWQAFWKIPAAFALAILLFFAWQFKDDHVKVAKA